MAYGFGGLARGIAVASGSVLLVMGTLTLSASNASAAVKIPNACALLRASLVQNSIGKLYQGSQFRYTPETYSDGLSCFAQNAAIGITLVLQNVNLPEFEGIVIATHSHPSGLGAAAELVRGTSPDLAGPFDGVSFNRGGIYALVTASGHVAPSEMVIVARTIFPHL